jgi:hypothetical protein
MLPLCPPNLTIDGTEKLPASLSVLLAKFGKLGRDQDQRHVTWVKQLSGKTSQE